ncbi:Tubby protein [Echinococcus granulosus]|uniref:Tubby protein n=1 Tax=Echinococcus granulosus TaxID=6210 RepID=W6UT24_ECHGR|nr:Tubby protein [Echinococcus granulosus]EUB61497.1 Tubby protein [Echinococcus granulosus]
MCSDSDPLTEFLSLVPYGDRKLATSAILSLRSRLNEHIDLRASINGPLHQIKRLKQIFTHTPISLRRSMRSKIMAALEQCMESSEASAVFVTLLVIIEANSLRNPDRSDLETADIVNCLPPLNSLIGKLTQTLQLQRSNLLSLRAWTIAMLVYTYRQCLIWCSRQDCLDLEELPLQERVPLDSELYSSPCVPKLLKIALDCQVNNLLVPTPKDDYLLSDLLLASAFSDSTVKYVEQHDENSVYNMLENHLDSACGALKPTTHLKVNTDLKSLPSTSDVHNSLIASNLLKVQEYLQIFERQILDNPPLHDDLKQICKELILGAPAILLQSASELDGSSETSEDCESIYCSFLCGFLHVWIYALEKRLIFEDIPQSYLYLCGFTNVKFQAMRLKDFIQTVGLVAQFLTVYLRVFRSNVLASPHWFLQMLSDCVTAIIDRLSSGSTPTGRTVVLSQRGITSVDDEELTILEYAVSPCIAAVSRTWISLRADEPDSRPELSRAVKGILDIIAVRIAAATVPQAGGKQKKWRDQFPANAHRECSALRPRMRHMLNQGLVFPILDMVDPWALQQSRVGLKPAAACEVLRTLVTSHRERERLANGERGTSAAVTASGSVGSGRHGVVTAPAAIGGLSGGRLKAKAVAKRQQQGMDAASIKGAAQRRLKLEKQREILQKKRQQKHAHEVQSLQAKSFNSLVDFGPISPRSTVKTPSRDSQTPASENFAYDGPQAFELGNPDLLDPPIQVLRVSGDKNDTAAPTIATPKSSSREHTDTPKTYQAIHIPPIRPVKLPLPKTPLTGTDRRSLFESMELEEVEEDISTAAVKLRSKVERRKVRSVTRRQVKAPLRPHSAMEASQRPPIKTNNLIDFDKADILVMETSVASATAVRSVTPSTKHRRVRKHDGVGSTDDNECKRVGVVSQDILEKSRSSKPRSPRRPAHVRDAAVASNLGEELKTPRAERVEQKSPAKHLTSPVLSARSRVDRKEVASPIKRTGSKGKEKVVSLKDDLVQDASIKSTITRIFSAGDDVEEFITTPAPKGVTVCCRISRDKHGLEGGLFPSYFLHLERQEDGRRFFLLAARRKRRATTCNYLISLDATAPSTTTSSPLDAPGDGRLNVGHLRSNFLGTQFVLLSSRRKYAGLHTSTGHPDVELAGGDWSKEIATISYVSLIASLLTSQ